MHAADDQRIREKLLRLQRGEAPRVVDLFSGCGGMSLGFNAAGCQILAGIELEEIRAKTHARNFHGHDKAVEARHGQGRDVTALDPVTTLRELNPDLEPEVDILVGGPPCQAYARVGRAKLREIAQHPEAYQRDPRGQLYASYIRWVEALQPIAVVMENVPDILSYGGVQVAEVISESLEELGYECRYTLLNAAFFGVPQTRERWYLIGVKRALGVTPQFPALARHVELPRGYLGTRSHALAWATAPLFKPPHAVVLQSADPARPRALSCKDALGDLPHIPEEKKNRRGARDLDATEPYRVAPTHPYQRLMRQWKVGSALDGHERSPVRDRVSAHVVRCLRRDWETFRMMRQGAYYPEAHRLAVRRFDTELTARRARGELLPEGSAAWQELRDSIVPPYDHTKFPNKWWKLQADFPSRTLMAHLSHDSYSHIHYDDAEARTISVREAARLQSFPDSFEFCGAMNAAFGQIGNAVPPLMAYELAKSLLGQLRAAQIDRPVRQARSRMLEAAAK